MATPVEMPKLGNTVEECLVAKWRKQKGDPVSAGEVLAEIETDKATFELTSPVDGTLLETFFAEGALVPVFTNLCVVGEPGQSVAAFRPGNADTLPASPASDAAQAPLVPEPGEVQGVGRQDAGAPRFSPRASRFAAEHGFYPASVTGSGPGGRVLEEDLRKLYDSAAGAPSAAKKRTPNEAEVRNEGSGAAGRILSSGLGPPGMPLSGIREKIARRLRESVSATAQYTLHTSAGAAGLLALRARIKAAGMAGRRTSPQDSVTPEITIGDLVAFCAVKALLEFPDVNAELIDGMIHRHAEVHLGFACDTPRGLLVPVVRNAHTLALSELSRKMKELGAEAVQGTIAVDDLSGATFTVSNLGALGIEWFTPLLNPPQVAILGVDAIQVRPVRREERIEFSDSIGLSLTCDHQVIDGAPGARFLQALKNKIENVETLCDISL